MTPRLPGAGHLRHWQMVRGEISGSRVEIVLTCQGLRPRRVHVALAVSHPMMLPSVNSTTSAPGNLIYISWLNGWPVNTPVNASPHTSRYATHDSGTLWIAGPSMVGDFHPLISNLSPGAHCIYIQYDYYLTPPVFRCQYMRLVLIFRHKKAPGAACKQIASFPENFSWQQILLFEIFITLTFILV